eukprot:TRINITY_DN17292_c0_g2_i1.p3 TRINITY_DN17292_c0_g2~~TRINITY_DN17292_c0_g2_i1.p3  ORF type:complete len:200 (-),score=-7.70 TRINITY_DN17292_c0_g2_i1:1453-2052(-)
MRIRMHNAFIASIIRFAMCIIRFVIQGKPKIVFFFCKNKLSQQNQYAHKTKSILLKYYHIMAQILQLSNHPKYIHNIEAFLKRLKIFQCNGNIKCMQNCGDKALVNYDKNINNNQRETITIQEYLQLIRLTRHKKKNKKNSIAIRKQYHYDLVITLSKLRTCNLSYVRNIINQYIYEKKVRHQKENSYTQKTLFGFKQK